jgi:hypothetical protein
MYALYLINIWVSGVAAVFACCLDVLFVSCTQHPSISSDTYTAVENPGNSFGIQGFCCICPFVIQVLIYFWLYFVCERQILS